MPAPPTGTITFLFTDIEGSTARWEAHGGEMKAAVASHDALLREIFERHEGFVFKTVGDAFCVAFPTAPNALESAIEGQRALAGVDHSAVQGISVRMGLHTGHAEERDNDYFGPTVNRVARIMSTGHGGQIIVSSATRSLLQGSLPSDTTLIDLGLHRLKDLSEPEHVWQVHAAGLRQDFPALNSLDALPNNLPNLVTSFHGRESDLEELEKLIADNRLVTIAGMGGIGKTRLALQAAADALEHYPDGVWVADLEAIRYPDVASSAVAKALNVGQPQDRSADEAVVLALRRKNLLLIFDNCEHVTADVAKLTDAILRQCPDVHVLATSRQPLEVSGEHIMRLEPLAVPEHGEKLELANVMTYPAIALFVDRASAVNKSFALKDDDDAFTITQICRHLDGLPLAIELAAARMKVLSLRSLSERLSDRFGLLTGGSRTAQPRQRTLTGLIDWSYELLTPQEQSVFSRLSVFAGGFSLDAAEAVSADEDIDGIEVLDLLASLTDKSLVIARTSLRNERYHMLESIRAYAFGKLKEQPDVARALERRHAEYFVRAAAQADQSFGTKPDADWLAEVEPDIDNFRIALEWSFGPGEDPALGGAIAGSLQLLWSEGGLEAEGRQWIDKAIKSIDEQAQPRVAARLWRARAGLSTGKRCYEAAERACALSEGAGEGRGLAYALYVMAAALQDAGRLQEAAVMNDRVYHWFAEFGDKRNMAACLRQQANMLEKQGQYDEARRLLEKAMTVFKALDAHSDIAAVWADLAKLAFRQGDPALALRDVDQAIEFASKARNASHLATYHSDTAAYRIALGNLDAAKSEGRDALHWAREAKNELEIAAAIQHLALVSALQAHTKEAARLYGYVENTYDSLGETPAGESWTAERLMVALRDQLEDTEISALRAEGATWSEEEAIAQALSI